MYARFTYNHTLYCSISIALRIQYCSSTSDTTRVRNKQKSCADSRRALYEQREHRTVVSQTYMCVCGPQGNSERSNQFTTEAPFGHLLHQKWVRGDCASCVKTTNPDEQHTLTHNYILYTIYIFMLCCVLKHKRGLTHEWFLCCIIVVDTRRVSST